MLCQGCSPIASAPLVVTAWICQGRAPIDPSQGSFARFGESSCHAAVLTADLHWPGYTFPCGLVRYLSCGVFQSVAVSFVSRFVLTVYSGPLVVVSECLVVSQLVGSFGGYIVFFFHFSLYAGGGRGCVAGD